MALCEDYPCCGHELGDCDGSLYGSDESIKADAIKHIDCDHAAGVYACEDIDEDYDDIDEDAEAEEIAEANRR